MSIVKDAIEFLFSLGRNHQHAGERLTVDSESDRVRSYLIGKDGAITPLPHPVEPRDQPLVSALSVTSLHAVADYLARNIDQLMKEQVQINVADPATVQVFGAPAGWRQQRPVYLTADAVLPELKIDGEQMTLEELRIMLTCGFLETPERSAVLRKLSLVTAKTELSIADDGFSAAITTRAGMELEHTTTIDNPIELVPMRSFLDTQQVSSPFILRLYRQENSAPRATLRCADGGAWEIAARAAVAAKLSEYLSDAGVDPAMVLY